MKRILAMLIVVLLMVTTLSGCSESDFNKQIIDLTYGFDKAVISLPNGEIIEGKIDRWTDFEDGDQIQVTVDGVIYLVHSSNVVLIKEK
jgi:hypothetical protein